ncbi:MAG: CoA transferase [Rubrivivax sp.]
MSTPRSAAHESAGLVLGRLRVALDDGVAALARCRTRGGRLDSQALDARQVASFELAWAAAELLAAETAVGACQAAHAHDGDAADGTRVISEVARVFDRHGVCWSRYQTIAELVETDPECSPANPLFTTIEQPGVGPVLSPAIPLAFAQPGRAPPGPAPRLGEHTQQVLGELLGIGSAEFGRLLAHGVVGGITAP